MRRILSNRYIRIGIGILISTLTLYLALRDVSLWEVSRSIGQAIAGWLVLGVFSVLINIVSKAIRWYGLMGGVGQRVGLLRVLAILLAGQLLNLIYPARAGDVSRVVIVGKDGNERAFVFGSLLTEKLGDLIAYLVLIAVLFLFIPRPAWLNNSGYILSGVTVGLLIGVVWLSSSTQRSERFGRWLASRRLILLPRSFWLRLIEYVQSTLSAIAILRQRKRTVTLLIWTVLVWLTALVTNITIWIALGWHYKHPDIGLQAPLLVLVALMVGIAIPSVPGRIGIFEYICVLALAVYGVGQAQALTYGIILHAVVFLPVLVLGSVALLWLSWKPTRQASTTE